MSVFEMARQYYPRLWDKSRIEALISAGRLTREEGNEIVAAYSSATGDGREEEKFNQMFKTAMNGYRKELQDNDSGAWSKEAREYAVSSGLFAGSGTTPDGQPNYMWEDLLTREQVAQLFFRFAQRNGLT